MKGVDNAFPLLGPDITQSELGLTKREYLAAMAMQGLMAACSGYDGSPQLVEHLVKTSVVYADALINELNKEK